MRIDLWLNVPATYASADKLYKAVGFKPETSIEDGLEKIAEWYVKYYGVESKAADYGRFY